MCSSRIFRYFAVSAPSCLQKSGTPVAFRLLGLLHCSVRVQNAGPFRRLCCKYVRWCFRRKEKVAICLVFSSLSSTYLCPAEAFKFYSGSASPVFRIASHDTRTLACNHGNVLFSRLAVSVCAGMALMSYHVISIWLMSYHKLFERVRAGQGRQWSV